MGQITVSEMIEILKECEQNAIMCFGENLKITNVTECLKDNRVSLWSATD